jgi:drug/metabolite transporter (DMT)-like permease
MLKKYNFMHQMIRTANLSFYIWLTILIGNYASKANINQGIIYACVSSVIVFNIIMCYFLFNEKVTIKTYLGIVILVCGVVWISIAKNTPTEGTSLNLDEEEVYYNRIMAISLAVLSAFVQCLRPVQAKWIHRKLGYQVIDFTIDSGMITGIIYAVIWTFYYLAGHDGYTWGNCLSSFAASCFIMFWGIVGLNAQVKGLQAPATAIMQANSLFSTLLAVVFLGQIPNM